MKRILLIFNLLLLLSLGGFAANLYWVGGTGSWSDASHWSLSNGGAGNASVPTYADNVFFTSASFAGTGSVIVDNAAACADLTFMNLPKGVSIEGTSGTSLSVYGSMKLDKNLSFNYSGDLNLKSPGFSVLNAAGVELSPTINIDLQGGTLTLASDLTTSPTSTINFIKGNFLTKGYQLNVGSFIAKGSAARSLQLSQSTVIVHDKWILNEVVNLTLDAQQSSILTVSKLTSDNFQSEIYGYKIVKSLQPLAETVSITEIIINKCSGDCNSKLVATVSGGVGPYTYKWILPGGGNTTHISTFSTDTLTAVCESKTYGLFAKDVGTGNTPTNSITTHVFQPIGISFNTTPPSCNSSNDGNIFALTIGGTGALSYLWSDPLAQTSNPAVSLVAGTYSLTVTDANGCTASSSTILTSPAGIVPNSSQTNVNCFGLCTGSAGVSPTGGSPPYTYIWTTGATSATISALCAGNYTLTITDNNGCTVLFTPAITQPASGLSATTAVIGTTNVSCFGACDGTVGLSVSGGTPTYTYLWSGAQTSASLGPICAAGYTVTVTDANSCTTTATANITQPPLLATAPTGTNISCFSKCDGTVNANASGGNPPYTYAWAPSGATSATVGLLCPNTYSVTVTDSKACTITGTVVITQPNLLVANATETDLSCNGVCNGTVSSAPTGGTTPYTYLWSNGPVTPGQINVCQGSYTVSVTDANGCTASQVVVVNQPATLTILSGHSNASCNGVCDGSVNTFTVGGTSPYTYLWSNGKTIATISGLCANGYTVTVTDASGCTATTNATVTEPNAITVTATPTPTSCNGGCNGTITASPSGGTAPFTYTWSNLGTGVLQSGLCAGPYTVTVTDANGCSATSTATIVSPPLLTVSLTPTDASCSGLCNGSITSSPAGGTPLYTYNWSNFPTTQNVGALCTGTYTLTVTDANACTATSTATINAPVAITFTATNVTDATCNGGCDGSAAPTVAGGTPAYTYAWSTTAVTPVASPLCQGTYSLTVTDANGCTNSIAVTVNQPTPLNAAITSSTSSCNLCNGSATVTPAGGNAGAYTFTWNDSGHQAVNPATALCVGNYTVTVTDTKGCTATGAAVITPVVSITVTTSATLLTCTGACDGVATANVVGGVLPYTYAWSNGPITKNDINLCAGIYTVTVTDAGGCSNTATASFIDPAVLLANATNTNVTCNGLCDGTATAAPTGGTGAYTYNWMPGSITLPTLGALCAGSYTVTVKDANGCTVASTVTVTQPAGLADNASQTNATCGACDGVIHVAPTGGSGVYTYTWAGPAGFTSSSQNLSALCTGTYTLSLSSGGACQQTFTYNMSNTNGPVLTKTTTNTSCYATCDGAAHISVTGNAPFTYLWSNGGTNLTISGLCIGIYTVSVTDNPGCITIDTFLIKRPSLINPNAISSDVTCGGAADGAIILSPNGGTAPYTYSWSNTQTTSTITNLGPGPYTFTITDANGCDSINTITITEPAVLVASILSADVTCKGSCNGGAFASAAGGTLPYTYSWSDGAILGNDVNLCAGPYTVTVTDANGCTSTSTTTITEPATALSVILSETDVSCNGGSDGTVSTAASGGTPLYAYTWVPGTTASSMNSLTAGTYAITVTDANGCTFTGNTTVNQPTPITFTSGFTNVTCNGNCDGTANATASGGTGVFNYSWSNTATGQTINGLCPGLYVCTATDVNGCTNTVNVTITEPAILLANVSGVNPNCLSATSGSVTSSPSGGTTPYTYIWNDPSVSTTPGVGSLPAGSYTVTVTDANGCTATSSTTLTPPVPITVISAITPATCGVCDGSIVAVPSGGSGGYTYTWSNGEAAAKDSMLCAANYSLTVTDVAGCSSTFVLAVNNTSGPVVQSNVATNATCNAGCDGTATVTMTGGILPYTYSWTDIANNSNARTGMCAGNYTLAVTDANGCITNVPVVITEPPPFVYNATVGNVSCSGKCDGSITIAPTGGTGALTYAWSNGSTGATLTSLCAASYTLTISDASLCSSTTVITVGVTQVLLATVSQTNPLCNGVCTGTADITMSGGNIPYTYNWSNGAVVSSSSALCANTYTVSIVDFAGCNITQAITIVDPAAITITSAITTATCGVCNGQIGVTPAGGTGAYTYVWGTGSTSATITNACAGVYTLNIDDANGCVNSFVIPLNNTNGPTKSTIAETDVSCFGKSDGTATVTGAGGTPAYTYSWTTGQTNPGLSGLSAGLHLIQVTDANGCLRTDSVNIGSPTQIMPNQVITDPSCGSSNGQIVLAPTGGAVGAYTYTWSTTDVTATISALGAGTYNVTITDNSGCTQTLSVPLSNVNAPVLTMSGINGDCAGSCNGTANVSVTGGVLPYTYSWSTTAVGATISSLCAATYTCTVTDAAGCVSISTVTITEPLVLSLTAPATQQVTCNAACNGAATALPLGGTLPYSYAWSTGATATTIGSLCSGTYTITVTDVNGCSASQTIVITPMAAPFVATPTITNATCGQCNGLASVAITGGTLPYNYLWSNAVTGAADTALCAGLYSVDVSDANGCKSSFAIPISNAGAPTSSGKVVTNITCNGQCNGTATLSPVGGTLPYTYLWLTGSQTTSSLTNLCAGSLFVEITDSMGCTLTDSVTITQPPAFAPNDVITPPSGCGVNDGSVTLNPSGGTGTYTYSWSGALGTSSAVNSLGAGLYTVTITDAAGCAQSTVIPINNTTSPVINNIIATNVTCAGKCDGQAIATAGGGTGSLTYSWNNTPPSLTATATALCVGSYFLEVTDAAGCVISSSITITQPMPVVLSSAIVHPVSCFGTCDGSINSLAAGGTLPYNYTWNNGTVLATDKNLCANIYTVTVTDVNGCTTSQVNTVGSPLPITITKTPVSALCSNTKDGSVTITVTGGTGTYTYSWTGPAGFTSNGQNLTTLTAGTYPVTVTDAKGCTKLDTAIVGAVTTVIAMAGNDTSFCQGTTFNLNGAGSVSAVTYQWLQLPSLTVVGSTATSTVTPPAGITDYMLVAINGVCMDTDTVVVTANALPVVDAGSSQTIFSLQSTVIGGNPTSTGSGVTYLWTPGSSLSDSTSANPTASPFTTTVYTVMVKDGNGCVGSDTVRVVVEPEIKFNNGITPNGDGKNDTWIIDNIIKFPKCVVEVYNRWGELLFTSTGYTTPWDGKYKGADLPVGTYYYAIKLNDPSFPDAYTGPITIMR